MDMDHGRIAELFRMLQKNNKNAPPLATRLRSEAERFNRFSRAMDGLLVDFSRTGIDEETLGLLLELAACSGIETERERLYQGSEINFTEHRPVLHPLWRERNFAELLSPEESSLLGDATRQLREIAASLHTGCLPGDAGSPAIRHVVHVGIGLSLIHI